MDSCYHDQGTAENRLVDNEQHSNQPRSSMSMDENKPNLPNPRRVASSAAFDRDLDSSESIPSDHSSLYDAARASFVLDDEDQTLSHGAQQDASARPLDSTALSPSHLRSNGPPHPLETITEQQSSSTLRRSRSVSQVHENAIGSDSPSKERRRSSFAAADRVRCRKVVSFDDSGSDFGASNWQHGTYSPVFPTEPVYPPPARSPTPPGLPSFGSIEALNYSSRFTIESSATSQGRQRQRSPGSTEGFFRRRSQGGALRRFLGALPPSGSSTTLPMHAIARADDGTAVRGRFPYRQSGHGVDLTRPLDRHPFHRSHLPVATPMHADSVSRTGESRRSKSGDSHEGLGPSRVQTAVPSPSNPTAERPGTAEPRTVTTTSGVGERPLSSSQYIFEAHVPQGYNRVCPPSSNANRNTPAVPPSVGADGLIPTSNPVTLPGASPGMATTDGTSETTGDNHRNATGFWVGAWKNISDAFCCVAEEDEEDTTRALYPPESRRRDGNQASLSSTALAGPRSRTRGSEVSQAGRRYSGPWRPAYGFHPGETSASSVV